MPPRTKPRRGFNLTHGPALALKRSNPVPTTHKSQWLSAREAEKRLARVEKEMARFATLSAQQAHTTQIVAESDLGGGLPDAAALAYYREGGFARYLQATPLRTPWERQERLFRAVLAREASARPDGSRGLMVCDGTGSGKTMAILEVRGRGGGFGCCAH